MSKKRNRSSSKISKSPEHVRRTVEKMIKDGVIYNKITEYVVSEGIPISRSAVGAYAKRFLEEMEVMELANQNIHQLVIEAQNYPDLDVGEVMGRLMGYNMIHAIMNKTDEDWVDMPTDKLVAQGNGLINALARKNRVDVQNKDKITAAQDGMLVDMFIALERENPELYRQVSTTLKRIQKESDGHV